MKDLPHKFQFRTRKNPSFTHSCKLNAYGDYEVKWARGFFNEIGRVLYVVYSRKELEEKFESNSWIIVVDKPKQENSASSLPDEFLVQHSDSGNKYILKRVSESVWHIYGTNGTKEVNPNYPYSLERILGYIEQGAWKIVNKPTLTAEQQKQLKEFKEQIAQLEQSIKLNQQDICHKERLVANYEQRKSDVLSKIAELEGV